jgi:tRNA pseudouridine55 synthase
MSGLNKLDAFHGQDTCANRVSTEPKPLCGVLVIDKPLGVSSMHVVAAIRRQAGGVRTGHAGTLDPLATGVLVMALGRATRCIDQLMDTDKRYRTTIDLSAFTATDDAEGERTTVEPASQPDEARLRVALRQFVGHICQRPPAFSAIKVNGRRAYKLARRGEKVELQPRPVVIHSIDLLRYDWPLLEIDIHCEKGVYVRALARDLGESLGTGGHCTAIRRTAVGPFILEMAKPLNALPTELSQHDLLSIDNAIGMVVAHRGPATALAS